ncbi:MAG: hypothetical protein H7835_20250, partial [Magnetococcus sp. XQGC-1]
HENKDGVLRGHDESETLYLRSIQLRNESGKTGEIIDLLKRSVSLNPRNHRALNNLAWTLIDLDISVPDGVDYAKQAVEVFPDSPHNNGTLGVGYQKLGDVSNAKKYLQLAVKLYPIYAPGDHKAFEHDKARLAILSDGNTD